MKKLQLEKKDKLIMLTAGIFLICFLCVSLSSLEQYLKIIVCCSLIILLVLTILVEKNVTKEEIPQIIKKLVEANKKVYSVTEEIISLEDAFLKITEEGENK